MVVSIELHLNSRLPCRQHWAQTPYVFARTAMANANLSKTQREEIIKALRLRFEKNRNRHMSLDWAKVQTRLEANTAKLWSLHEMERTGGEPDVVGHDKKT